MPPRPIVHDALWRCLCPSFPSGAVTARPLASRNPPLHLYSSAAHASRKPFTLRDGFGTPNHGTPTSNRKKVSLVHLPTVELYERLRHDAAAGRHEEVMSIIRILTKDRRERPNVALYSAIVHSYANPEEGTAGKVRKVLEEMQEAGIELDARGCQCVLEALAVHPDYLLRTEILEYMKERWFTLTDRGHNMVVAGLLRDRLFEQALEKIDDMVRQRIRVEPWLWDKTMWLLLDYGEVEEAYQVLLLRQNEGNGKLSNALWVQFVDVASKAHHAEAVNMTWNTQVVPGYLKPATGTCLNILSIAARRGDVKLATDVFRVLSERETIFDSHHYEMLMEAYLNAKDLNAALSVAIIMQEAGLKLYADTFQSLYTYLSQDASRPMESFNLLQNFESSDRKVPTAAVNACLHACVHLGRLEEAIEIYKALHTVSKAGPDTQTFNILFQGCYKARRKELAMFLASEMIQLNLSPDRLTYDRLVLVCCHAGDLVDGMLYYEEMIAQGYTPRKGTFEVLLEKGVEAGDERTPAVLKHMNQAGFRAGWELAKSVKERFAEAPIHKPLIEEDMVEEGAAGEIKAEDGKEKEEVVVQRAAVEATMKDTKTRDGESSSKQA